MVLVGHSYGGIVITEAAAGNDAVVGLVYVAAFAPDHGESAFQLSTMYPGSTLGDALAAYPVATEATSSPSARELFHQQFAADVPAAQAALMAGPSARSPRPRSPGLPTDSPAWKDRPSWFVFGDQDLNIPVALQRFMAERAGAKGTRRSPAAPRSQRVRARRRRRHDPRRRRRALTTAA